MIIDFDVNNIVVSLHLVIPPFLRFKISSFFSFDSPRGMVRMDCIISDENAIAIAATTLLLGYACEKLSEKKKRKKRKCWVKPWIASRKTKGAYHNLITELSDRTR